MKTIIAKEQAFKSEGLRLKENLGMSREVLSIV